MKSAAGFLVLLSLCAAGSPLLLRKPFRRFGLPSRLVLAGGSGAVLLSFTMTVFALAGVPWTVPVAGATAVLLAWAIARCLPSPPAPPAAGRLRAGLAPRLAAILSATAVGASLAATLAGAATSPDLFYFWGAKAQQFASARGIDTAYLAAPFHGFMHPYYPPLVTNLLAFATLVGGSFSWSSAMWSFPVLLAALAIGLPGVLEAGGSRALASAASALAVAASAVVGIRTCIAGNGDMPLVFFEALAVALLLRHDAIEPSVQTLAGLLLAGAAATKVEGLPFVVAASALFLILERKTPGGLVAPALRLLAPTALTLGTWFAFGASRHLFHEYSEYGPFFVLHFEHWRHIASAVPLALAGTARGLPYLVPLVCLAAAGRPARAALLPLGTAMALFAFLLFAYLHPEIDPSQWISWSAARVLMPVPVLLALALGAGPGRATPPREERKAR
jgi:hypothetical protein